MKGYKVSQGNKRVILVYENVITPEEKKIIREFYLPAGFEIQIKHKDIEGIKARAEKNGFASAVSKSSKDELIAWVKEKDPDNADNWEKKLSAVSKGGLGFSKGKAEFRKTYPNYPESISKETEADKKAKARKK